MKLLFIIDSLGSGGAQRQMVTLARGLKARGHHVEFFVYYPQDHYRSLLDEADIPVHLHLKSSRFSVAPLFALRRFISQHHYDLVLSFLDTPNFYAEFSRLGLRKPPKLIVSERFMYPPGKLPLNLRLLQECHRLADGITVNSHHQRIRMEQKFPWMKKKLRTIYNGIDLEIFKPMKATQSPSKNLRLLAIASVSYKKNSIGLATALVYCQKFYGIAVNVDWVGDYNVSGEGTRPKEETDRFLAEQGLLPEWRWLGVRADIPQLLANYDALIHPSFFEGLPNVVCEALACGKPVLASNVCDHGHLVQEGTSGFLFEPKIPESIARAINELSELSPVLRIAMGKAARSFAEQHLSGERYVDEYEDVFIDIEK